LIISEVRYAILLLIPIVLCLLFLVIRLAIEKGLKPLELLKVKVDGIDVEKLSQPIVLDAQTSDLESLVTAMNTFLARISAGYDSEKRFSADAAHELKTPISEIMNMAEVAIKWPDKVNHLEFYRDLLESSEKMNLIVKNLLELARAKNQAASSLQSKISVSQCISDCWKTLNPQAKMKNVSIEINDESELKAISSEVEFAGIVSNLLSNAVEYGRAGSCISVLVSENNGLGAISISNYTDDLESSDLNYVFDSLWRKDKARKSDLHIGIGLAIVKEYAALLELELEVILENHLFTVTVSSIKSVQ
jgi:signal transduction histidine kinase